VLADGGQSSLTRETTIHSESFAHNRVKQSNLKWLSSIEVGVGECRGRDLARLHILLVGASGRTLFTDILKAINIFIESYPFLIVPDSYQYIF